MKKSLRIISIIVVLLSLLLALSACGTKEAKVTGIEAGITDLDESDFHLSALSDDSTLSKNDYVLNVGEQYRLVVGLTYNGGSRQPGFENANNIKLYFDSDLFQIGEPNANSGQLIYPLECKQNFAYTVILVEGSEEYHTEVIVSTVK